MRILLKASLIVVLTTVSLISVTYYTSNSFMMEPYVRLEDAQVRHNVQRLLFAIQSELSSINKTTGDYSAWDDTYAFIRNKNTEYITSNLQDSLFTNQRLNFIIFFDAFRNVVFARAFDLNSSQSITFPSSLLSYLAADDLLQAHENTTSSTVGIINGPNFPIMVASQPIVTSEYQGPIRGTLIMGLYLDGLETEHLASITGVALNVIWGLQMPQNVVSMLDGSIQIKVRGDWLEGSVLLKDIEGQPSVIVESDMHRDIYTQGITTVQNFLWMTLLEGAVFALITMVVMHTEVLSRVSGLSEHLEEIGKRGDSSNRLPADKHADELASLTGNINRMLEQIQTSNERVAQSERLAAIGQLALMVGHDLRNPLQSMTLAVHGLRNGNHPNDIHSKLIRNIEESIEYADRIVRNLSDYSSELQLNLEPTRIISIIKRAIASSQVPRKIRIKLPENDYIVTVDPTAMQRVLVNLVRNACDAMPQGGELAINTSRSDGSLQIDISDTGTGVPRHVIQNLGKPLQTTKARGLGLGLAISKRIVEAHGGSLSGESFDGKGSNFRVTIHANDTGGGSNSV